MDGKDCEEVYACLEHKYDEIRETCDSIREGDPDYKVFTYLIADTFEQLDEGVFYYTDGPNDLGIDFYIRNGHSFTIYQCKSTDHASDYFARSFDATPVNELTEAVDFLLEDERKICSNGVKDLWEQFNLDRDANRLTAVLAIEGHLTDAASERFAERKKHYSEYGIDFILIDEQSFYEKWIATTKQISPRDVQLTLHVEDNGLMPMHNWFCAVVSIDSLIEGMNTYGNGLFELNVRAKLAKSSVNKAIANSLKTKKSREQFVHLNNGLVITCNSFKYSDNRTKVTLRGAQVINGCQTLSTIWECYKEASNDSKEAIRGELKLIVKVINNDELSKDHLMDQIIVSSNNQNPMKPRNLKSNTKEQLGIQRSLYTEPLKTDNRFFYIRKDGELEAFFLSDSKKTRDPKKSDFKISNSTRRGVNQYRHIDNEVFGQIWLSWIGNSPSVNSGAAKIFSSEQTYSQIFLKRPCDEYWQQLKQASFQPNQEYLDTRSGDGSLLLLSKIY